MCWWIPTGLPSLSSMKFSLGSFPLGVLGREFFDLVDDEDELEVDGLLAPQAAIVVESGDAFGWDDVVRRVGGGDALDERDDSLFVRALVPGGQRIGESIGGKGEKREEKGEKCFHD